MPEILVSPSLEIVEPHYYRGPPTNDGFVDGILRQVASSLSDDDAPRRGPKQVEEPFVALRHDVVPEAARFHSNYMCYLEECWKTHHGVVLTPDILWYTIINEVALLIKEFPEEFRPVFSTSEDKQEILVHGADALVLEVDEFIEALKDLVPANTDLFLPEFTTTTGIERFANRAAFMDAVSPYYSYSMFICGIPKYDLRGTKDDWSLLSSNLEELTSTLNAVGKMESYLTRVTSVVKKLEVAIDQEDSKFMKEMIAFPRCGSGSQITAEGWFTKLFVKIPSVAYSKNFSSHISSVEYTMKNYPEGKNKFALHVGLFSSAEKDGFLVPQFNKIYRQA